MANSVITSFKVLLLAVILLFGSNSYSQLIFNETFGEAEGATSGSDDLGGVTWSALCPACIDAGDYFKIQSGKLVAQDSNGPATWTSSIIDISDCDFIDIEFDLWEEGTLEACGTGCNSVDYVQFEYNIDGAGWMSPADAYFCSGECADVLVIQSDDIPSGYRHYSTGCISGGSEIQIRITVQVWAASERWIVDNVQLSCAIGPELNGGPDQTLCEGESTVLTASNPDGATLSWNNDVIDGVSFTPDLGSDTYIVSGTLGECTATDTVIITVVPTAVVSISPAGPFSTVSGIQTLIASPAGGSWSSDCGPCINPVTGEFDPAISGVGVWTICYHAGTAPCDDEECITITVTDGECILDGIINSNNPTCFGFSDGSVTINMTGETGTITYSITNAAGTVLNIDNSNTANSLGEGWYYFVVEDEFPCTFIDSIYLNDPDQMIADLTLTDPLCYGGFTGSAIVSSLENPTGDPALVSYIWSPNPSGENGIGEDSLLNANAGVYNLSITDENGCSIAMDFELVDPDSLYLIEFGYYPAYCRVYDYQNGNGVVFASAVGGTPDYDYIWTNLETGATTINTTWGGLNPGDYQIEVIDNNGCAIVQTITVDSLNPIANFTLTSPQFTANWEGTLPVDVHFINTSSNFANPNNPLADTSFFWNFGLGSSILSTDYFEEFDQTYTTAGDYTVCLTVSNKNGCTDSICKLITVYDPFVFVPVNIFSPNNDGINDVFTFAGYSKSVNAFNCVIVNRWGIAVAELNSISDVWNGELPNGSAASAGVYFYTYSGQTDNGTNFEGQGTVQIVQ